MSDRSGLWRTERLVFRAIEDNDEDLAFFHTLQCDPTALPNVNASIAAPQRKSQTKEWLKELTSEKEYVMSVLACIETPGEAETLPAGTAGAPSASTPVPPPGGPSTSSAVTAPAPAAAKPKLTPIGVVALDSHSVLSAHHRSASLVIEFLKEHPGRGYGSEALRWITDFAFRMMGLHCLCLGVFGYNARACAFYERCGFVLQGRFRQCLWFDGAWHDNYYYGMLEDEWRELKKQGKL